MKNKRLISGIFMVAILASLILYSGIEYNNHDPSIEHILENFETYNNTKISFSGVIKEVNTTNQQITISIPQTPYVLKIKTDSFEDDMQKGNIVEILGVLDGKCHVSAEKILVIERWKSDLIIIRSLPAIPFALYLFFRTWRFNKETFRFERRNKDACLAYTYISWLDHR